MIYRPSFVGLWSAPSSGSLPPALPANIFASGNSLLRGDPTFVPIISVIDALADQDGNNDVDEAQYVVGGYTLKNHYQDASWHTTMEAAPRTHFIMQGQSLEAAGAGYADFITYGKLLAQDFYAENPNGRILCYSTPAYNEDNSVGGNPNIYPGTFDDPEDMRTQVVSGYTNLRDEIRTANPTRIPAQLADVTSMIRGLGGGLDSLHPSYRNFQDPDGLHWADNGRFLVGCYFYVLITGRNPTSYAAAAATAIGQTLTIAAATLATWAYRWATADALPPLFLVHPEATTVPSGGSVTLTVSAIGSPAPTLQWYKDGVIISGATSANYNIPSFSGGDEGDYTCRATNSEGTVESEAATLVIGAVGPELKLDFSGASTTTDTGWTTVLDTDATKALVDVAGASSGCNWVRQTMMAGNVSSQGSPDGSAYTPPVPTNAVNDFWFGNDTNPIIEGYVENLPVGAVYNIRFISCRSGISSSENRHTKLTITGVGAVSNQINSAGNLTNTLTLGTVTVPANGRLLVRIEKGASNDNASGFYYNNAISFIPA